MRGIRRVSLVAVLAGSLLGGVLTNAAGAATQSPIAQRYNSDTAVRTLLGAPTGAEFSVAGGSERDYKWGSLYYSKATGVHEVHGANWWKYRGLGGPAKFGFPKADEKQVTANVHGPIYTFGAESTFTGGEIYYNADNDASYWLPTSVATQWSDAPFPYYGEPTSDPTNVKGGQQITFTTSTFYKKANSNWYVVFQADADAHSYDIFDEYKTTGLTSGYLGWPTANIVDTPTVDLPYGKSQTFESGAIYTAGFALAAHAVHGAIYWAYTHQGGGPTSLGYPTNDEQDAPGGRIETFQHGSIFWNASTNNVTVTKTA